MTNLVSYGSLLISILALVLTQIWAAATYRRNLTDRNLDQRIAAYADFLTTQDSRFGEYERARDLLGAEIDQADVNSPEVSKCRRRIKSARKSAWEVQARIQILAPLQVREAAESYADAITDANPLRMLPGGKRRRLYVGLGNDRKGQLKDAFVAAARHDLESDRRQKAR